MEMGVGKGKGRRGTKQEYVFRNEKKIWGGNCRRERLSRFALIYFPENPLDISVQSAQFSPKIARFFVHSYKVKKVCKNLLQFAFVCGTITVSKDKTPSLISSYFARDGKVEDAKTASLCGLSERL